MLAGSAAVLLAFSPAYAQTPDQDIIFVPGTGEAAVAESDTPDTIAYERTEPRDAQAEMMDMADRLSDPRMQDGVAHMVGNMSEKLMDLPIGKFAAAMERAVPGGIKGKNGRRIRENDTLADLAGRDAERLPDQLADGSRQMMGMMSGFAAAFATMIPEFEKLSRDLEKSFEDAKDARGPRD